MNEETRRLMMWGAAFGLFSVLLGAFGAHALRERLTERELATFETAVRYQSIHALAIFAAVGWASQGRHRWALIAANLFVVGTLLFSGSLYGLSVGGWKWLGPVTPLGGLCFSAGWLMLFLSIWRRR